MTAEAWPAWQGHPFVCKVLTLLTKHGIEARAEQPLTGKVHLFARSVAVGSSEHTTTFVLQSEGWAKTLGGNPVSPHDVAHALVRRCTGKPKRARTP